MAAERASARAVEQPATQPMRKGGGSVDAGRMITCIMTSESSSQEAGHNVRLSADSSEFPSLLSTDQSNIKQDYLQF
jgi:hypothetical protein